jgi:hypothetical protein
MTEGHDRQPFGINVVGLGVEHPLRQTQPVVAHHCQDGHEARDRIARWEGVPDLEPQRGHDRQARPCYDGVERHTRHESTPGFELTIGELFPADDPIAR